MASKPVTAPSDPVTVLDVAREAGVSASTVSRILNGTARVAWQGSIDTSAVWGAAVASYTEPDYVAAGAVPWLLVQVKGAQRGPTGGAAFTPTKYIQRINTTGGVMPTEACSETMNNGVTMFVPYTADYVFYKASN